MKEVRAAEDKKQFPELNREAEEKPEVRLGEMADQIRLLPGWDDPIDPDRFLEGDC